LCWISTSNQKEAAGLCARAQTKCRILPCDLQDGGENASIAAINIKNKHQ
jgi:hypothetical protein